MVCALAAHGATVWLNGRDRASLAHAVAQAATAGQAVGGSAHALPFDVTEEVATSHIAEPGRNRRSRPGTRL